MFPAWMRGWVYGGTLRDTTPPVKEPWSNRRSKYHYEHKTSPERHHGDAATSVAQLLISVVLFSKLQQHFDFSSSSAKILGISTLM